VARTEDRPATRHATGRTSALPTARGALPRLTAEDMPEPQPLRRVIGPGVIAAGVGLASGEFVLWPYISANVGLVFLWAMVVGVVLQYFLNMEVERYTLATGETALTGFSRLWRHWGLVFAVLALLANVWPGWVTSSATVLTYALDIGESAVVPIAVGMLAVIGLLLTLSPVVYRSVERVEFVKVGAVVVLLIAALAFAIGPKDYTGLGDAASNVGHVPTELGLALVLGALAFAGAGGAQNLVQSNWIRDKGFGMGARVPRLVSPITGKEEAAGQAGYVMRTDEPNLRRWHGWWKVANTEQLVTFVLITIVTITVTSLLAYATVFGEDVADDVSFLQTEGQQLNDAVGGWFGYFFWAIGAVSLFAAALGIVDYVARIVADVLRSGYLSRNARWSESRLYAVTVWALLTVGAIVLLAGFDQPLVLLVISAVVGAFMMFVYSGLLIWLNRRALPAAVRVRSYRLAALVVCVLFFGYFSALVIIDQVGDLLG
jgi:hypothetical protein